MPRSNRNRTVNNGKPDSTATEALRLHALGYSIVPCVGKKPIVSEWAEKRLTPEELTITINGTTNIAIALHLSNVIDVECDTEEAEANLQELFDGAIPPTPTWKSKRGYHRLFRRPLGLPEKAMVHLDGIEFRIGNGKAALSIVPPSVHPDGPRYEYLPGLSLHEIEPAELPLEIVEWLKASDAALTVDAGEEGDIAEGHRNDELFKVACKLFRAGLSSLSVESALHAENLIRCKPPLPEAEVAAIAKSACSQSTQKTQTHAEILLDIATADTELWHTPEGVAWATIQRDGHREHWRVRSGEYRKWLAKPGRTHYLNPCWGRTCIAENESFSLFLSSASPCGKTT